MTLTNLLKYGENELKQAEIVDYKIDAWYLLEFVFKINRAKFLLEAREEAEDEKAKEYKTLIKKRAERIPLQHITREQEFMGLTFQVNEHVLIPRFDTEILVETVLDRIKSSGKNKISILDMCTGSGCIIISLLYYFFKENIQCNRAVGADISEEALKIAKINNALVKEQVSFITSDLFGSVDEKYDLIVSNPPYIPTKDIEELMPEVKEHEPLSALDGTEDGLYFYKKIIHASSKYLTTDGSLFFEIGYNQGQDIKELMEQAGYKNIIILKDLAGLDRVVFGNR